MDTRKILTGSVVMLLVLALSTPFAMGARRKKEKRQVKIIDLSERGSEESREAGQEIKLPPNNDVIVVIVNNRIDLVAFLNGMGLDSDAVTGAGETGYAGETVAGFQGPGDPLDDPTPTVNPCEYSGKDYYEGDDTDNIIDYSEVHDGKSWTLNGKGGNDVIRAPNKPSVVRGGDGMDVIHGGKCADKLDGGDGDDIIFVGQGDIVIPSDGNDVIHYE
ncbi:MAG: hypothetical protein HN337_04115 [Deltaproteobacteria bacterium]|jgi:Ca2+-binding RTX toxin-like protein|nr:hypothetical protein [Deltaproteobacteria bacterium]